VYSLEAANFQLRFFSTFEASWAWN